MRIRRTLLTSILSLAATFLAAAAQPQHYAWKESPSQPTSQPVNNPRSTDGIEVYTRPGTLIVKNPERTTVTVLSILGQTISQTTINAGTHELHIGTHGIYIVKVGDFTLRVAL